MLWVAVEGGSVLGCCVVGYKCKFMFELRLQKLEVFTFVFEEVANCLVAVRQLLI